MESIFWTAYKGSISGQKEGKILFNYFGLKYSISKGNLGDKNGSATTWKMSDG